MSITNIESPKIQLLDLLRNQYLTFETFETFEKNISSAMAATKVALITASSAGLGAQIARVFAPDFRVVSRSLSRSRMLY